MKVAIVIQAAPRELREELKLQDFSTYQTLHSRIEHYIHTMLVWSSGSGEPPPMDIGAIAQLTKGKKGDKGAGKHKGKTKDAGKGKDNQTTAFEGYCNHCGKWGHRKSDCWSNANATKGAEKGKSGGKKKNGSKASVSLRVMRKTQDLKG